MLDSQQLRSGGTVVIPNVVVDHLKVPQAFARTGIEREERIGEQIGAFAIGAIEVVLRAGGRRVDDTARFVDRKLAPDIGAADGLPRIGRPGVVAEFTWMRDRVKGPHLFTCAHIKGAYVARGRTVSLVRSRPQNQEVLKYPAGSGGLDQGEGLGVAAETLFQIDTAARSK